MESVVIKNPKMCTRAGNVFTVYKKDLEGTILHQLAKPNERPVLCIAGQEIKMPDLSIFNLEAKTRYLANDEIAGEFIDIPDIIRVVDTLIGDVAAKSINMSKNTRKELLVRFLSKTVERHVVHSRSKQPGMMGFAIGADSQLAYNEIAISFEDGKTFIRDIIKDQDVESKQLIYTLIERLPEDTRDSASWCHLQYSLIQDNRDLNPATLKYVISELALALDGISVLGLRYPNASSTSHSTKTLRIYLESPANYIYIPILALIKDHQGDADGDRFMWHYTPLGEMFQSSPVTWTRNYNSGHSIDLDQLVVPIKKQQITIMNGFAERGKWVGMLTYNFWLLAYATANNYDKILDKDNNKIFSSKEEVVPVILDLFTPLIEGVMNTRKGDGSGTIGGESLAEAVCQMFAGTRNYSEVLPLLPVKTDGEDDEEKFTKDQIRFLEKVLEVISNSQPKCQLNNSITGASQSPILLAFCLRFKEEAIEYLLTVINPKEFCESIISDIMLQHKTHWKEDNIKTISDFRTQIDFDTEY